MNNHLRIETIGNIASGKTTMAGIFGDSVGNILEDFRVNPFWEAFYADPVSNAFETELTFTLQHYHQIKTSADGEKSCPVSDFSLWLDAAYSEVTLQGNRLDLYRAVHDELVSELGYPHKIVYLDCPPDVLMNRIKSRGRPQEQSISIEYLEGIQAAIENQLEKLAKKGVEVITIDSNSIDFAHAERDISHVKDMIIKAAGQNTPVAGQEGMS